ncbi:unnamed protein product [Nesidiocoris tenuis]|uniref:Uncharacterized protein n=1 Tax=Nesidiocoris tenuis TaxID=355587 RepID=A0A6H5HTZ3_9HEMI|nr:unnamed protein product [Nesidiocoris tenuis]
MSCHFFSGNHGSGMNERPYVEVSTKRKINFEVRKSSVSMDWTERQATAGSRQRRTTASSNLAGSRASSSGIFSISGASCCSSVFPGSSARLASVRHT